MVRVSVDAGRGLRITDGEQPQQVAQLRKRARLQPVLAETEQDAGQGVRDRTLPTLPRVPLWSRPACHAASSSLLPGNPSITTVVSCRPVLMPGVESAAASSMPRITTTL